MKDKLNVSIQYGYKQPQISLVINTENANSLFDKAHNLIHHHLWRTALSALRKKGFKVGKDKYYEKNYKILSPYHSYGIWEGLEFKSDICRRSFNIEFFQNVTPSDNRSGGYYDFNKWEKFPYMIKIRTKVAINCIKKALQPLCDCTITCNDSVEKSEDRILKTYQDSAHWNNIYSLSDVAENMNARNGRYNSKDRDGKHIQCGDIKYFYDYNGYLKRGVVYYNLNNMWWVISNDTEYHNRACWELFDRVDEPLRKVYKPNEILNKLKVELKKQITQKNFMRCHKIQSEIDKVEQIVNNNKK